MCFMHHITQNSRARVVRARFLLEVSTNEVAAQSHSPWEPQFGGRCHGDVAFGACCKQLAAATFRPHDHRPPRGFQGRWIRVNPIDTPWDCVFPITRLGLRTVL